MNKNIHGKTQVWTNDSMMNNRLQREEKSISLPNVSQHAEVEKNMLTSAATSDQGGLPERTSTEIETSSKVDKAANYVVAEKQSRKCSIKL